MAAATGTKPVIMQEKEFPPALQAIVNDRYEVLISPGFRCLDGVAPVALLSASHEPIDGAVLDAHGPGIKVVSNFGVGYDVSAQPRPLRRQHNDRPRACSTLRVLCRSILMRRLARAAGSLWATHPAF